MDRVRTVGCISTHHGSPSSVNPGTYKGTMKKLLLLAALLTCLVTPTLTREAFADTITTFALTGNTGLYTGTGTFTVNTTTGVVQDINFNILSGNPALVKEPFSTSAVTYLPSYSMTELDAVYEGPISNSQGFYSISIYVPVTTFVGYTGGAICSTLNPCAGNSNVFQTHTTSYFQNGVLTAVAVTPEPSSFSYLLLSIACVASLPFLRRRVLQDCA